MRDQGRDRDGSVLLRSRREMLHNDSHRCDATQRRQRYDFLSGGAAESGWRSLAHDRKRGAVLGLSSMVGAYHASAGGVFTTILHGAFVGVAKPGRNAQVDVA